MKHFYAFLTLLAALLPCSALAQQVSFFIDIDNPACAEVTVNGSRLRLLEGVNSVTTNEYATLKISANAGFDVKGTDFSGYNLYFYNGTASVNPGSSDAGKTLKITSKAIVNDASVLVTVDDPTNVQAALTPSTTVTLNAGANTVPYCTGYNTEFVVFDYSRSLYSVTADGQPANYYDGSYHVTLPAQHIDIKANYPDVDCNVKFNFVNPGTEGFISGVQVAGTEVSSDVFLSDNFSVKAGKEVRFYSNNMQEFSNVSVKINGEYTSFYGSASFIAKGNTEVTIQATKIESVHAVVNVTGAEGLDAQLYYRALPLVDGPNVVKFLSTENSFQVNAKPGYVIETFTVNGENRIGQGTSYLNAGDVIELVAKPKVYDNNLTVYLNVEPSSLTFFQFINVPYRTSYNLNKGYNSIAYASDEVPFSANFYSSTGLKEYYYLNDQPVEIEGYAYSFNTQSGDVLKLFYSATEPVKYDVNFDTKDDADCTVKYDLVKTLTATNAVSQHFEGTQFDVVSNNGQALLVMVNGQIVPASEGKHTFAVDGNSEVKIYNAATSGIGAIEAEAASAPVYNLQGIKVAEASSFEALPAGLYIVNGKKVVKK